MRIKDIKWKCLNQGGGEDHLYWHHCEFGKISVLDRLTGYSYGIRDIETGFKDNVGKFWLASGNFDIREFDNLTIEEAIEFIKKCSNTCTGV